VNRLGRRNRCPHGNPPKQRWQLSVQDWENLHRHRSPCPNSCLNLSVQLLRRLSLFNYITILSYYQVLSLTQGYLRDFLTPPPAALFRRAGVRKQMPQLMSEPQFKHCSYRTEEAYVDWAHRFNLFHHKRHHRNPGLPGPGQKRISLNPKSSPHTVKSSTDEDYAPATFSPPPGVWNIRNDIFLRPASCQQLPTFPSHQHPVALPHP